MGIEILRSTDANGAGHGHSRHGLQEVIVQGQHTASARSRNHCSIRRVCGFVQTRSSLSILILNEHITGGAATRSPASAGKSTCDGSGVQMVHADFQTSQAVDLIGAGDRDRTGDIQLGKLTFCH